MIIIIEKKQSRIALNSQVSYDRFSSGIPIMAFSIRISSITSFINSFFYKLIKFLYQIPDLLAYSVTDICIFQITRSLCAFLYSIETGIYLILRYLLVHKHGASCSFKLTKHITIFPWENLYL